MELESDAIEARLSELRSSKAQLDAERRKLELQIDIRESNLTMLQDVLNSYIRLIF